MSNISISISISIKECCRRLSVQGVLSYEELMVLSREVKLPWCGVKLEGCVGLLYNGGLYTQCGKVVEGEYCSRCKSKKESGKWNGSVSDRMNCKIGEYSVDGKNEISYMKWLSKNGISREMSEREASSRGLSIPLEHFVERERVRRGRKREPIVESVVDPVVELVVESVVDPVVDPVVESVVDPVVESVVESVVDPVVELVVESVVDPVVELVVDPVVELVVDPVVESVVELVVESVVDPVVELVVELVVDPVVESVVDPVVESVVDPVVELVVEPVKKKRGRPRKEKSVSSNSEGEELIASLLKERKEQIEPESSSKKDDLGDSDEEETLVIKIEIDGKTYLKSKDNTVFDFMSHDELGIWNEKEQKIVVE